MAQSPLLSLITRFFAQKLRNALYTAKESIGEHKREIVVQQVEQACISLQETRDEFTHALEQFKTIVEVNETGLEHRYHQLNRQYQFCRTKAEAVGQKIKAIEAVSEALFIEWEKELDEYTNKALRTSSKQQLKAAKQHYAKLIKALVRAETKIQPVLAAFKDQVLYLKHNLNARAIAALQHELVAISLDISQLIQAMELTIAEANLFVSALVSQKHSLQKSLPHP